MLQVKILIVGRLGMHTELEELVSSFVGKEAAIISSMGFATNSCNIPGIIGKVKTTRSHCTLIIGLLDY
jgi:7-keto-8-aminopelargonate synthetase-like enzyme